MTQHATDDGPSAAQARAETEPAADVSGQPAGDAPGPAAAPASPTLWQQLGGGSGVLASTIPIVVFIVVNTVFSLTPAIVAALGAAAAIAVLRLVRGEALQPAISGAIGVAIGAFIAHRTGEAKGFFLFGIWASLVYGLAFTASLLVRWPLIGVIWHALRGDGRAWRADRRIVRGYDLATLTWTLVFGARFVVQRWLYDNDETGALGAARLAMGLPLTAVAALVTVWAVRRANRIMEEAGEQVATAAAVMTETAGQRADDSETGRSQNPPVS